MRHYKVNRIQHTVFDTLDEVPTELTYAQNWRDGQVGDWVKADDDCVIQILRRGKMMRAKGKNRVREYVGTCTGTFMVSDTNKMDTSRRVNIYAFGGDLSSDDRIEERESMTSKEVLFVQYLSRGLTAQQAYLKAFPTNNPSYANAKAMQLVKTERIRTAMKEELKPVMEELEIDEKYVLQGIKHEADEADKADVRLKALFKLSDILDMEDKNQTKVQQVTGAVFQGFDQKALKEAERPVPDKVLKIGGE